MNIISNELVVRHRELVRELEKRDFIVEFNDHGLSIKTQYANIMDFKSYEDIDLFLNAFDLGIEYSESKNGIVR